MTGRIVRGRQIHNVEVLGQPKDLPRVVEELREANRAPARLVLGRSVKRLKGQEQLLADAQALNLALGLPAKHGAAGRQHTGCGSETGTAPHCAGRFARPAGNSAGPAGDYAAGAW